MIWFYYGFEGNKSNSPVDEHMALMVTCYFVVALLLIIPTINTNLNKRWCYWIVKCFTYLYLIGKMTVLLIMIVNIQKSYYLTFEDTVCESIENLTLFWLIWNYFLLSITFIYSISFIASSCCDDYYEYDYDY